MLCGTPGLDSTLDSLLQAAQHIARPFDGIAATADLVWKRERREWLVEGTFLKLSQRVVSACSFAETEVRPSPSFQQGC
jgi:hypothetical protein